MLDGREPQRPGDLYWAVLRGDWITITQTKEQAKLVGAARKNTVFGLCPLQNTGLWESPGDSLLLQQSE